MSLFPDNPPPPSPSAKPKLTAAERRTRQADRLTTVRLRMLIGRELDALGAMVWPVTVMRPTLRLAVGL